MRLDQRILNPRKDCVIESVSSKMLSLQFFLRSCHLDFSPGFTSGVSFSCCLLKLFFELSSGFFLRTYSGFSHRFPLGVSVFLCGFINYFQSNCTVLFETNALKQRDLCLPRKTLLKNSMWTAAKVKKWR